MEGAPGRTFGIAGVMFVMWIGLGLAPPRPAVAQSAAQAADAEVTGGTLLVRMADGSVVPAPLQATDVELRVTGLVARARVVQRFANPVDAWLEGVYVFPLPERAAVDHMDLRVGSRVIEGQIQEKAKARRTYAKARREGRKASLLEQDRPNLFTTSVANIGPGEVVEVAIEYQETLRYDAGSFRLRLPLVAAPRFEPAVADAGTPAAAQGGAAAVPAAFTPGAPLVHPDDGPVNRVRISVELDFAYPIERLFSPSHVVFAEELAAGRHSVQIQDYADRDFVLEWRPAPGSEPRAALHAEPRADGEGSDVLLLVMPPDGGEPQRLARDVVFVVDVSGSMGGASIRQARAALRLALARLEPEDHFNVIRFNNEVEALFPASVPAREANRERARTWVDGFEAKGGTDMGPALQAAFAGDSGLGELRQVIFMTDGSVANEDELFATIASGLGRSRLFTVGIGSAPNAYFLRRAAKFGRGTHTLVTSPGDVQARMEELFSKLERPVLSDIEVFWNDEVEMWPERVPDLYAGEPVVVTARLVRSLGEVTVRGRRAGRPWEVRLPVSNGEPASGIGVLWARSKIASLMDSLAAGGDAGAVRGAVVGLALEHHLVSRWTSLVAVDVTPSRPEGEALRSGAVPANLPAGWDPGAVGVLPHGATPAPLLRLAGLLLLLGSALVLQRCR